MCIAPHHFLGFFCERSGLENIMPERGGDRAGQCSISSLNMRHDEYS
jgi:hypothetical protein